MAYITPAGSAGRAVWSMVGTLSCVRQLAPSGDAVWLDAAPGAPRKQKSGPNGPLGSSALSETETMIERCSCQQDIIGAA
jgi:hypothetical protein